MVPVKNPYRITLYRSIEDPFEVREIGGAHSPNEGTLKRYTVWESHVRRGGMRGMEGTSVLTTH